VPASPNRLRATKRALGHYQIEIAEEIAGDGKVKSRLINR
jgi:hypothetical protein